MSESYLIIQYSINLRRCFVHDDNIASAQYRTRKSHELAFSCAQRATLTYWCIERDGRASRLAMSPAKHRVEMATFEDVPALLITVLAEWIEVTPDCA